MFSSFDISSITGGLPGWVYSFGGSGASASSKLDTGEEKGVEGAQACGVVARSVRLAPRCSLALQAKAFEIKAIHDRVEEVAYQAFVESVIELKIIGDVINHEQSGQILLAIKRAAHREMFKSEGGYIRMRAVLLDAAQVDGIIRQVGKIVHDRDSKLTDARYSSICELLMGLDDHNTMVKEILLASWFGDDAFSDPDHIHLGEIKDRIRFYDRLSPALGFDVRRRLQECQAFWDRYFPGARVAGDVASRAFIRILEVRHTFGGAGVSYDPKSRQFVLVTTQDCRAVRHIISQADLDAPLVACLTDKSISHLFERRRVRNLIRSGETLEDPILDRDMTLRSLLLRYFPEVSFLS